MIDERRSPTFAVTAYVLGNALSFAILLAAQAIAARLRHCLGSWADYAMPVAALFMFAALKELGRNIERNKEAQL